MTFYHKESGVQTLFTENENGLTVEAVETLVRVEKRHFRKGEFFTVSKNYSRKILELLVGGKITLTDVKVLLALENRIDYNNRIKGFKQIDISNEAKVTQANVSRALKKFRENKIIAREGVDYYFTEQYIKGAGDKSVNKKQAAGD
jgi:DNA-binding MarR family transcriptional regulator